MTRSRIITVMTPLVVVLILSGTLFSIERIRSEMMADGIHASAEK